MSTNEAGLFLTGLAVTASMSLAVVLYLNGHLIRILTDLCGTRERAAFWAAFSNVTLAIFPLVCAMFYQPQGARAVVLEVSVQLRLGLLGLIGSLLILGLVIGQFVGRAGRTG